MREVKTFPLIELKIAASDASGAFEGRASTFGTVDSYGDTIDRGAYLETIPNFLKRGFIAWAHDWANPIGMVTDAQEKADGLYIKGKFHTNPEAQSARTIARERIEEGKFMGLSIGYEAEEWEERKVEEPVRNRWGEWQDKVRALTKIKLFEVSLVTVPAEENSGLTGIKGYGFEMPLSDHAFAVRVATEELIARILAVSEEKVGRAISAPRRALITAVAASMRSGAEQLDGLVKEPDGEEEEDEGDPVIGLSAEEGELKAIFKRIFEEETYYKRLKGN